jgi:hypothetical protein
LGDPAHKQLIQGSASDPSFVSFIEAVLRHMNSKIRGHEDVCKAHVFATAQTVWTRNIVWDTRTFWDVSFTVALGAQFRAIGDCAKSGNHTAPCKLDRVKQNSRWARHEKCSPLNVTAEFCYCDFLEQGNK